MEPATGHAPLGSSSVEPMSEEEVAAEIKVARAERAHDATAEPVRIVLDTNVCCRRCCGAAPRIGCSTIQQRSSTQIYSQHRTVQELTDVLTNHPPPSASHLSIRRRTVLADYVEVIELVAPDYVPRVVIGDIDDDQSSPPPWPRSRLIVSGDRKHLLPLGSHAGIAIVDVAEALRLIAVCDEPDGGRRERCPERGFQARPATAHRRARTALGNLALNVSRSYPLTHDSTKLTGMNAQVSDPSFDIGFIVVNDRESAGALAIYFVLRSAARATYLLKAAPSAVESELTRSDRRASQPAQSSARNTQHDARPGSTAASSPNVGCDVSAPQAPLRQPPIVQWCCRRGQSPGVQKHRASNATSVYRNLA